MWTTSGYRQLFSFLLLSTFIFSVTFFFLNPNAGTNIWSHIQPMTGRFGSNHQDLNNQSVIESANLDMLGGTKLDQTYVTSENLLSNKSTQLSEVEAVKYEKLYLIVAYRDREENKEVFVKEMNSYLTRKECQLKEINFH